MNTLEDTKTRILVFLLSKYYVLNGRTILILRQPYKPQLLHSLRLKELALSHTVHMRFRMLQHTAITSLPKSNWWIFTMQTQFVLCKVGGQFLHKV